MSLDSGFKWVAPSLHFPNFWDATQGHRRLPGGARLDRQGASPRLAEAAQERVMNMVAGELKEHPLPKGFEGMVKRLTRFPKVEPEISVSRGRPRSGSVEFLEDGSFFVPLVEGAEALAAWYNWPERKLTGTSCVRVLGKAQVGGAECLKVRIPDFDPDRRWIYDHVWYWTVKDGKIYFVAKSNFEPSAKSPPLMTWQDADWDEDRTGQPISLPLKSRIRWDSDIAGSGPRFPRTLVPGGVWTVMMGDESRECLRALSLRCEGRRVGRSVEALCSAYYCLAELFIALDGRTFLFRRYNGPAWRAERAKVSTLAKKGCPALHYNGVEFRLWYDCIPYVAICGAPV